MGSATVDWLRDMGWTVYQEVKPLDADIVAVLGKLMWIVECKRWLNLTVIGQAVKRIGYGQYVSVAVPHAKWKIVEPLLQHYGIGLIMVGGVLGYSSVHEYVAPRFRRQKTLPYALSCLVEQQKDYAVAGSPGGAAWSDFKATCERLRAVVQANPGIALKEALTKIEHHYASMASAKRSLAHWIERDKVKGIRSERGRSILLYPCEDAAGPGSTLALDAGASVVLDEGWHA